MAATGGGTRASLPPRGEQSPETWGGWWRGKARRPNINQQGRRAISRDQGRPRRRSRPPRDSTPHPSLFFGHSTTSPLPDPASVAGKPGSASGARAPRTWTAGVIVDEFRIGPLAPPNEEAEHRGVHQRRGVELQPREVVAYLRSCGGVGSAGSRKTQDGLVWHSNVCPKPFREITERELSLGDRTPGEELS